MSEKKNQKWYIDRAKNFNEEGLRDFLQAVYNVEQKKGSMTTKTLFDSIKEEISLEIAEGNPNAAFTGYRDHGLIKKDNTIGDSAKLFLFNRLNFGELILDLFVKRFALKGQYTEVRPFVVLCTVFSNMIQMELDPDDIFLTIYECHEYLINIESYDEINFDLIEKILNERTYTTSLNNKFIKPRIKLTDNEKSPYVIWFNALKKTPLFLSEDNENNRNILYPNQKQKEFFRYIKENADEFANVSISSNSSLYDYYCNRKYGFAEIVSPVIKKDISIEINEVEKLFDYLFGYDKHIDFDYTKYLKHECFGVYFAFISIPGIALAKVNDDNPQIAQALHQYAKEEGIKYIEKIEKEEFMIQKRMISGTVEYKMKKDEAIRESGISEDVGYKVSEVENEVCSINEGATEDMEPDMVYKEILCEPNKNYSLEDLAVILEQMYNAPNVNKTTAIHMFGLKYGDVIRKNKYSVTKIVAAANISPSYHVEVSKGVSIYESILNNEYGVGFYSGEISEKIVEKKMLPKRMARHSKRHPINCILYGAPGTGKTYITTEYVLAIVEDREVDFSKKSYDERKAVMQKYNELVEAERVIFTTFHQSYGYEDFIQGLRPNNTTVGLSFKNVDGVFKKIADKAMMDSNNNYVIVIDEINRANISKVFGELITLIEDDKRWGEVNQMSVTLPSGEVFAVPNNLYIVGTMNSADKSISLIDVALRRRFEFVEQKPDSTLVEDCTLKEVLEKLNISLSEQLDSTDLLIGHSYFMNKTEDELPKIFNNSIIPLLYEYFYDNKKKVISVLDNSIENTDFVVKDDKLGRIFIERHK